MLWKLQKNVQINQETSKNVNYFQHQRNPEGENPAPTCLLLVPEVALFRFDDLENLGAFTESFREVPEKSNTSSHVSRSICLAITTQEKGNVHGDSGSKTDDILK